MLLVNNWAFGSQDTAAAINDIPGLTDQQTQTLKGLYPYVNVLAGPAPSINPAGNEYLWAVPNDVGDQPGVPGQGPNPDPASIFPDHAAPTIRLRQQRRLVRPELRSDVLTNGRQLRQCRPRGHRAARLGGPHRRHKPDPGPSDPARRDRP